MSNTRKQYKEKINLLVTDLSPIFDWLEHNPILQVTGEESRADLKAAHAWLQETKASWLVEYEEIMDQPHTGRQFWTNAKVFGISADSMVGDVSAIIELRRYIKKFARVAKNPKRPVLFGGTAPKKRGRPSGKVCQEG